jgi:hypothetical protein
LLYVGMEECGEGAVGGPVVMGTRMRGGTIGVVTAAFW